MIPEGAECDDPRQNTLKVLPRQFIELLVCDRKPKGDELVQWILENIDTSTLGIFDGGVQRPQWRVGVENSWLEIANCSWELLDTNVIFVTGYLVWDTWCRLGLSNRC